MQISRQLFGLDFKSIIALECGYDPFAENFSKLGNKSAFIEIGPITPEPQDILQSGRGIFKRTTYGPNASKGVRSAIENLKCRSHQTLIAANISYNETHCTVEEISKDFTTCFTYLNDFVDIFIIDTFKASYNKGSVLEDVDILSEVMDEIHNLRRYYEANKPLLIRMDSTICDESLNEILDYVRMSGIDGVILRSSSYSPSFVAKVMDITKGRLPIIVSGGIENCAEAHEILDIGASMIQVKKENFEEIEKSML